MRALERPVGHRLAGPRSGFPRLRAVMTACAALAAVLMGGAALAQAATPTVQVRYDAKYGYFLTDSAGMTLYYFAKDGNGSSACNGPCAQAWPPLQADNATVAPLDIPGSFSVITREDGTKQVAYNGRPLYTFKADQKPGDTHGQGARQTWWVANLEPAIQTLKTADGTMLVGPTGMTLYTFGKDSQDTSACTGTCATNWPPLVGGYDPANGYAPAVGKDVKGTIGVISRDDGGMQLTLDGKPLYYFRGDTAPGDATGDGLLGQWQKVMQQ